MSWLSQLVYRSVLIILIFFSPLTHAQKKSLGEIISTRLILTGDIKGNYDLAGPMGSLIESTSSELPAECEISSLFRKVTYREQRAVEAWLTFNCMFEGHKIAYKPHRIFLKLSENSHKIKLPALAKNLRNIQLDFQDLSIQKSK